MKHKVIEVNDATCILGKTNFGIYDHHLIDAAVVDVPLDLEAILITHEHADHFTWANTLKKRTGALVAALGTLVQGCHLKLCWPNGTSST